MTKTFRGNRWKIRCNRTLQMEIKIKWIRNRGFKFYANLWTGSIEWILHMGDMQGIWFPAKKYKNTRIFSILSCHIWLINNGDNAGTHTRHTTRIQYVQHSAILFSTLSVFIVTYPSISKWKGPSQYLKHAKLVPAVKLSLDRRYKNDPQWLWKVRRSTFSCNKMLKLIM